MKPCLLTRDTHYKIQGGLSCGELRILDSCQFESQCVIQAYNQQAHLEWWSAGHIVTCLLDSQCCDHQVTLFSPHQLNLLSVWGCLSLDCLSPHIPPALSLTLLEESLHPQPRSGHPKVVGQKATERHSLVWETGWGEQKVEGHHPSKCFHLVPDASLTDVCLSMINSQLPEMSLPDKAAERPGLGILAHFWVAGHGLSVGQGLDSNPCLVPSWVGHWVIHPDQQCPPKSAASLEGFKRVLPQEAVGH